MWKQEYKSLSEKTTLDLQQLDEKYQVQFFEQKAKYQQKASTLQKSCSAQEQRANALLACH